jgi:WD repeat-containing protein 35
MKWADDGPELFVSLEKQILYVYRKFVAEEPLMSMVHICSFTNLVVTAVDFISLFRDPLKPSLRHFHRYDSKSLRDVRSLLQSQGVSQDEIVGYIKENSHPTLWMLLFEFALKAMNLELAELCALESQNHPISVFIKKVLSVSAGNVQKGYVHWYLGNYRDAERLFVGTDLAVQMYASTGNWSRVAELVSPEDEDTYTRCHLALGTSAYVRGDFKTAASEFALAQDFGKQLRSLCQADDFAGISDLMAKLPAKHALLAEIGRKFMAYGSHERAVDAFLKLGDAGKAVDACAHLNQWTAAVRLADSHSEIDKRLLMGRYAQHLADNSHISAAVNI